MSWWRLVSGTALCAVGLVSLAATRWAMRRGRRPAMQVVLLTPLAVGTFALIGGVGLVLATGVAH